MVNQISTNLISKYAVENKNTNTNTTKAVPQINSEEVKIADGIMKKETADAIKSYSGFVAPKPRPNLENKTVDEMRNDLIAKGKVEDKDFSIKHFNHGSNIEIIENGKIAKEYVFDKNENNKEILENYREYSYPIIDSKGLKSIVTTYGADNKFRFRDFIYDKEKSPYKDEFVDYNTKAIDLINKLKEKNIKFTHDIEFNGDIHINKFAIYDKDIDKMIKYEIVEGSDNKNLLVHKFVCDENGSTQESYHFGEKEVSYTEFKDSMKY